jgi:hypothetical protein
LLVGLAGRLVAAGVDPAAISIDSLLDPIAKATTSAVLDDTLRNALAGAIQGVFIIAFIAAALALVATSFAPAGGLTNSWPNEAEPNLRTSPRQPAWRANKVAVGRKQGNRFLFKSNLFDMITLHLKLNNP